MKRILAIIAFAAATILPVTAGTPKAGDPLPKIGGLIPEAKLPATAGKVVLVDFWASWCAPCKASFPVLNQLQAKYAAKGLVIIGISVDEDAAKYKAFAEKKAAAFNLVHDSAHKAAAAFNVSTMPTSFVVDRKGIVRFVHTGFHGAKSEAEYIKQIEALLAEGK